MSNSYQWNARIVVDDTSDATRACVRSVGDSGRGFVGIGQVATGLHGLAAMRFSRELAVARALADLTEDLLEAIAGDVAASLTVFVPTQAPVSSSLNGGM